MFKFKIFNILALLLLISWSENNDLAEEKIEATQIKSEEKGGKLILNNEEITPIFFGYEDMPNETTLWKKTEEKGLTTLKFTNKNNIKFTQKHDFHDPNQPKLEIWVSHKEKKLNMKIEIKIKTNSINLNDSYVLNFGSIKKQARKATLFEAYKNEKGWIAITSPNDVYAIAINKEKFELEEKEIKIYKNYEESEIIHERFNFYTGKNQYLTIKKQKDFPNLEECCDFGYYLKKPAKTTYILLKKAQSYVKSIWISILFMILLWALIFTPFTLSSIEMQRVLNLMQPELDAINNDASLSFTQKQAFTKSLHARYKYGQITHLFPQILLMIALNIFQSVFNFSEFQSLLPSSLIFQIFLIAFLVFTFVIYNIKNFGNNQPFFTTIFALFFINYPHLPLICFIALHWFNIMLAYLYKKND